MTQDETGRSEILAALQHAQRLQSAQSVLMSALIAARVGINAIDLECLDILQIHGPMPAGHLATHAALSTATMTTILDRLEKAGFVKRDRSGADRRVVLVQIEPKAFETIGPHYRHIGQQMSALQAAFTDQELEVVVRFTEGTAEAVGAAIAALRDEIKKQDPG